MYCRRGGLSKQLFNAKPRYNQYMDDYTKNYHFDTPQETLDFLLAAKYCRYYPGPGLHARLIVDEYRALELSTKQLGAIDPRLATALNYFFHNNLPIIPLLKESILRWRQHTPLMPYPADMDVGGEGEDRLDAPPAYWNQNIDSIMLRSFSNKRSMRVCCIDVEIVDGVEIIVRCAERLLPQTEEAIERLCPGTGARYRSALDMCSALRMDIEQLKDHIFPHGLIVDVALPALDDHDAMFSRAT
jgi:hypothetical protein